MFMPKPAAIAESSPSSALRTAEAEVDALFIERWSTRAFSPEPVPSEAISSLFEAARWAPAMGGIHHESTYATFSVPEAEYESLAAIAVGYPGDAGALPADLAAKELPNGRKRQVEFVFRGRYAVP